MKNLEIVSIVNAYMAQRQAGESMKLPAKVAWIRRVNLDKLVKAKQLIDDAMREIRGKYQDDEHSKEVDADGKKIRTVKEEYLPEFLAAQSEILEQETDVDIKKVSIDEIGDIELTDAGMDTIAFMIEGGE